MTEQKARGEAEKAYPTHTEHGRYDPRFVECARGAFQQGYLQAAKEAEEREEVAMDTGKELAEALARVKELEKALKFYGYEAIHNPESKNKAEQYWNDAGIWDHGERARQALKGTK